MEGNCTLSIFPRVQTKRVKQTSIRNSIPAWQGAPGEPQTYTELLIDVTLGSEIHRMKYNFQRKRKSLMSLVKE